MARLASMRRSAAVVAVAVLPVHTQDAPRPNSPTAPPTFEAASVKLHRGVERTRNTILPGGRYSATNVPLRMMIRSAFGVQDFQIVGGPSWIDTDGYDVAAKAATDAPPPQLFAMLRQLLEDRFRLVTRRETRDTPIYALVPERAGTPGRQIRPAKPECGPPSTPGAPRCGIFMNLGEIRGVGATLTQLATSLSPMAGRLVQDRTGVDGAFDFELQFEFRPAADSDRPSLFTAVREQLGLKLEPTTAPVDVLVIDRIERPTED